MTPCHLVLDASDIGLLDAEAARLGTSRSAILRRLIREHLAAERSHATTLPRARQVAR